MLDLLGTDLDIDLDMRKQTAQSITKPNLVWGNKQNIV